MKAFLEEYGFAILSAIVVILLIMMISPVGTKIKESLTGITHSFTETADNGLDTAGNKLKSTLEEIGEEAVISEEGFCTPYSCNVGDKFRKISDPTIPQGEHLFEQIVTVTYIEGHEIKLYSEEEGESPAFSIFDLVYDESRKGWYSPEEPVIIQPTGCSIDDQETYKVYKALQDIKFVKKHSYETNDTFESGTYLALHVEDNKTYMHKVNRPGEAMGSIVFFEDEAGWQQILDEADVNKLEYYADVTYCRLLR